MITRRKADPEDFWKFTDEEMEIAKSTDLPDLLEHLGYHLKRSGRYYTTQEMDSLMIKDRRTWKRYSNDTGGDAITFLQIFEGKGFRESVDYLLDFNGRVRESPSSSRPTPPPEEDERPEFALPPANPGSPASAVLTTRTASASSGMCWAATKASPFPSPATLPSPGFWCSRPPPA